MLVILDLDHPTTIGLHHTGLGKTHRKKVFFFSGRTPKGVGRLTPNPNHQAKKHFFPINSAFLAQKLEKKIVKIRFRLL